MSANYSVVVPVANIAQADELGRLGSILAKDKGGEVLALNVVRAPAGMQLEVARQFLDERREVVNTVIDEAKKLDVPVHTVLRVGRSVSNAIVKTVEENVSDMLLFGWPGTSGSNDRLFGSIIDPIVANPPTDLAILRSRPFDKLGKIVVPIASGPNANWQCRQQSPWHEVHQNHLKSVSFIYCPKVLIARLGKRRHKIFSEMRLMVYLFQN